MLRMVRLPASEFIRQVRRIALIIALGLVSGHPTSARDVDSETAAIRAAILADIERQKIELALTKIKSSQTPKDLEFACKDLLNIRETQDNCSATCRHHRDRCNERGY